MISVSNSNDSPRKVFDSFEMMGSTVYSHISISRVGRSSVGIIECVNESLTKMSNWALITQNCDNAINEPQLIRREFLQKYFELPHNNLHKRLYERYNSLHLLRLSKKCQSFVWNLWIEWLLRRSVKCTLNTYSMCEILPNPMQMICSKFHARFDCNMIETITSKFHKRVGSFIYYSFRYTEFYWKCTLMVCTRWCANNLLLKSCVVAEGLRWSFVIAVQFNEPILMCYAVAIVENSNATAFT